MNELKENKQAAAMKMDLRAQCQMREQSSTLCAHKTEFMRYLYSYVGGEVLLQCDKWAQEGEFQLNGEEERASACYYW